MNWTEEQNTVVLLRKLKELEGAVSELYRVFSERSCKEDREFWKNLSRAELNHMKLVDRMMDIFRKKKAEFNLGFPLKTGDVINVICGIKEKTELAASGQLLPDKFLVTAKFVESGMFESKLNEILIAKDPEFISLATLIMAETRSHHEAIDEKVKAAGML